MVGWGPARGRANQTNPVCDTDNAGQPISERLTFYLGEVINLVKLGDNGSRSEVDVLDDVTARLTIHNVSRDMSGRSVTCRGYDVEYPVVQSSVNIRVAGTALSTLL